jgi:hypothetical protein
VNCDACNRTCEIRHKICVWLSLFPLPTRVSAAWTILENLLQFFLIEWLATATKFEKSIKEKLRNGSLFKTNQKFTLYVEVKQVHNWMYTLERVLCNEITLTFGTRKWYFRQNKCQGCHQHMQFLHKEGDERLIWWLPITGLRKNSLNLRNAYLSEIYTWNSWFQILAQRVALMTEVFVWFTKSLQTSIVSDTFYVSHNTQTSMIHLHIWY